MSKTAWIVAAAVAVVLVLALRVGSERGSTRDTVAPASSEPALVGAEPPALTEVATPPRVPLDDAGSEHAGASDAPPVVAAGRIWLVGALLGLPSEPTAARIRVVNGEGWSNEERGAADGTYSIEVTRMVPAAAEVSPAATLLVSATHCSGLRAQVELRLADAKRLATSDGDQRIELPLTFAETTSVIGRVVTTELAGARAELCKGPNDPGHSDSVETECDELGRFALFPPSAGACRLVATAHGVLPLVLDVAPVEGRVLDVGELVLDRAGVVIEGRLAPVLGRLAARPAGFVVRAERPLAFSPFEHIVELDAVLLRRDGIQVRRAATKVRADGSFRIEGLDPGRYELALDADSGGYCVPEFASLEVAAPADGVVLGDEYGLVRVRVAGIGPNDPALVTLTCGGDFRPCRRTHDVAIEALVDRRAALTLRASGPGRAPAQRESAPGTRALEEEFVLEIPSGAPPAAVELTWSVPDGATAPARVHAFWRSVKDSGDAQLDITPTGGRIGSLPPGRVLVLLEAYRSELGSHESDLCVAPFEVEITVGQTTRAHVSWVHGGEARFVPDVPGRAIDSLRARVLDSAGVALPVRCTMRELRAEGPTVGSWGDCVPLFAPSRLEPNLPPGRYVLALDERPAEFLRVPFTIVAGEVVDVPVLVP